MWIERYAEALLRSARHASRRRPDRRAPDRQDVDPAPPVPRPRLRVARPPDRGGAGREGARRVSRAAPAPVADRRGPVRARPVPAPQSRGRRAPEPPRPVPAHRVAEVHAHDGRRRVAGGPRGHRRARDAVARGDPRPPCRPRSSSAIVRGGFPELHANRRSTRSPSTTRTSPPTSSATCVALANVGSLRDFERFLRACALRSANLLNKADLARDVGIAPSTANQWLSVLEASGQVVLLEPWFSNRTKTIVKSPKLYFADTGLLCALLNIRTVEDLRRSPSAGAVWETFVFAQLRHRERRRPRGRQPVLLARSHPRGGLRRRPGGHLELFEASGPRSPAKATAPASASSGTPSDRASIGLRPVPREARIPAGQRAGSHGRRRNRLRHEAEGAGALRPTSFLPPRLKGRDAAAR